MNDTWPDVFAGVPRETLDKLHAYLTLVGRWNQGINLVSKSSLEHGWSRHILDSAQLFFQVEATYGHWLDLGSGAGFPGLVVAILHYSMGKDITMTLIEADQRKAAFLMTASREFDLQTVIIADRIEKVKSQQADIISARALASLVKLLPLAKFHLADGGQALFLKGKNYLQEVEDAQKIWNFNLEITPSVTDAEAVVLKIWNIEDV